MADTDDSREKQRARHREYMRKWKAANPERAREIARKSDERHRESRRAADREWKASNRHKVRAWNNANKEKINAQKRALREANRDKVVAQERAWRVANPEKMAFWRQRTHAIRRNIPFLLTFEEWWKIWLESGRWQQRGRRKGQYCMARFRDLGAYELGNVRIILGRDNLAEADQSYKSNPRGAETRKKLSEATKAYYARVRHAN